MGVERITVFLLTAGIDINQYIYPNNKVTAAWMYDLQITIVDKYIKIKNKETMYCFF